jgi:hypothetical protein
MVKRFVSTTNARLRFAELTDMGRALLQGVVTDVASE